MPMMAYRSAVHEATGINPYGMIFGRTITLSVDLTQGRVDPITKCTYKSEYEYRLDLKAILRLFIYKALYDQSYLGS